MLENQNEIKKLRSSLIKYFDTQKQWDISKLLKSSYPSSEQIGYDNWNGGIDIYAFIIELEMEDFIQYRSLIDSYKGVIKEALELFVRNVYNEQIGDVRIVPICKQYLNWDELAGSATKNEILGKIEELKNIMVAVSTGGPKIQVVDNEYKKNYLLLEQWLKMLGADNPNPYKSLWDWYGRWSQSDLSTYASRRKFIPELYQPLIDIILKSSEEAITSSYEPTGWDRVDRTVYEMKQRLISASTEEQLQAIGMLGRETIITIAQQVYDNTVHKTEDGVEPSETDAKRMMDAFLSYELSGASNERTRKFAKSTVDMANHLTHDRTATKRDASMCLTSVTAVASLMKIIQENSIYKTEFK